MFGCNNVVDFIRLYWTMMLVLLINPTSQLAPCIRVLLMHVTQSILCAELQVNNNDNDDINCR